MGQSPKYVWQPILPFHTSHLFIFLSVKENNAINDQLTCGQSSLALPLLPLTWERVSLWYYFPSVNALIVMHLLLSYVDLLMPLCYTSLEVHLVVSCLVPSLNQKIPITHGILDWHLYGAFDDDWWFWLLYSTCHFDTIPHTSIHWRQRHIRRFVGDPLYVPEPEKLLGKEEETLHMMYTLEL